jgi:hypothetical protein
MESAALRAAAFVAILAGGTAAASDDPFAALSDPSLTGSALESALDAELESLRGSDRTASYRRGLYFCAPASEDERQRVLGDLGAMEDRGRAALTALGLAVKEELPDAVVVRIATAPGTGAVARLGDRAILLRGPGEVDGASSGPPAVRRRIDGPPLVRDLVAAFRAQRAWVAAARDRSGAGDASEALASFLASRLVASSDLPEGAPAWLRLGLVGHAASRVRGDAAAAATAAVPPDLAAGEAAALERLYGDDAPPPAAAPLLARVVGALAEGRKDLRDAAAKAAAAKGMAARGAVFGKDLAALTAEACRALAPVAAAPGDGLHPCFLCTGRGTLDASCTECAGTGGLGCPSCGGSGGCWAGNCHKGMQEYEGGKKVRCRFCTGGNTSCQACGSKRRVPCLACRGKGKEARPCLACHRGRIPGPSFAAGDSCTVCDGSRTVPCGWCVREEFPPACEACHGAGIQRCKTCFGTLRDLCGDCDGTGEKRMVYADGSQASVTKCPGCGGRGFADCRTCNGKGRLECGECAGKGVARGGPADCTGCSGSKAVPCAFCGGPGAPAAAAPPPTDAELEEQRRILDRAVEFLFSSRTRDGVFALRDKGKGDAAGALRKPTAFSNAQTVWALLVAGIDRGDERLAQPLKTLASDAGRIAAGTYEDPGTQETAFVLRALLVAGQDPGQGTAKALVDLLVKAQRPSGLWNDSLDGSGDDENLLDSLIGLEALYVARSRGAKIPASCWSRAYSAGSAAFSSRGPSKAARGRLDGIDVVVNLALIVMARDGMLGEKAAGFDYRSLPDVQAGLAWLDRHFDATDSPVFVNGAPVYRPGGGTYFAWVFALQRLAGLLRVEELGGTRWFPAVARHIRGLQRADGSFEEKPPFGANWSVRSTTDAVLFLVRATAPVTEKGERK